jgi:hypothetical protein
MYVPARAVSPMAEPPDGIQPVDICTTATDSWCALAALTHTPLPDDPPGDFTRYGYRVPLVVISPLTKPH